MYRPPYSTNNPGVLVPHERAHIVKYEHSKDYMIHENSNRKYSDNFVIHFEDSESEGPSYQGFEKSIIPNRETEIKPYENARIDESYKPQRTEESNHKTKEHTDYYEESYENKIDNHIDQIKKSPRQEHEDSEIYNKSLDKEKIKAGFRIADIIDDNIVFNDENLDNKVLEAAKSFLKVIRINLDDNKARRTIQIWEILKIARNSGNDKLQEILGDKISGNDRIKYFLSLRKFIHKKEQLIWNINESLSIEYLKENLEKIFQYIYTNVQNHEFSEKNLSPLDETLYELEKLDKKYDGNNKCKEIIQSLKSFMEEIFSDLLVINEKNQNNPENEENYEAIEEEYLEQIKRLENQLIKLEERLEDNPEIKPDESPRINYTDAYNRLKDTGLKLKKESDLLDQQLLAKNNEEQALKKEAQDINIRLGKKKGGCILI